MSDDVERDVDTVGEKLLTAAGKPVERVRAIPWAFGNDEALHAYASDAAKQPFQELAKKPMHQLLTGAL